MSKYKERLIDVIEYAMAALFMWGGVNVFLSSESVYLPGIFGILVADVTIYLYGILFFLTGVALAYGKIFKKKRWHKHSLLAMYLICFYVLILALSIDGIHWGLVTTVLTGIVSGFLWIRWKFKTEYVNPHQFQRDIDDLHNDRDQPLT